MPHLECGGEVPRTSNPIALIGIGCTELTKSPTRSESELAVEACRLAAVDAGIDPSDLDGINIQVHHYPPPDTEAISRGIGITDVRWSEDGGLGIPSLVRAAKVIDSGTCRAIVVCKIMNTLAPVTTPDIDPMTGHVGGYPQFEVPYGLGYTMQRVGFMKRRWMHRYGITDEQVGWLCVSERRHAMLNPVAIAHDPLSIDDYLNSRWIADPIHVLDCDFPVNGAFAYIVTRGDIAESASLNPVYVKGWSGSDTATPNPHLREDPDDGMNQWARQLYADTGLTPQHMKVWMLYDGFSFLAMQWMEQLGLVASGESGAYVEGGARIDVTGEHPVNTHGGQLSEGRMHAAGHILEAVRQIRGDAGERQTPDAEFAIVSSAFPQDGAAAIFGRGH
jgi:acetyl-CoA acetyltransferase